MKWLKPIFALILLAASMASTAAWADRYHHHGPRVGVGVVIGAPGPWAYPGEYVHPYYYPPYDYPYAPVIVAPAPMTYIQQDSMPAPAEQQSNDWFYCRKPDGYYPYVKQCPGGWQRVASHPPQ